MTAQPTRLGGRIAPTTPPPQFASDQLGGSASLTSRPLGPPDPEPFATMTKQAGGVYRITADPTPVPPPPPYEDTLVWRGEFRAASGSVLTDRLDEVQDHITAETVSTLLDAGRSYEDMKITALLNHSPRYIDTTGEHVQPCELVFARSAAS